MVLAILVELVVVLLVLRFAGVELVPMAPPQPTVIGLTPEPSVEPQEEQVESETPDPAEPRTEPAETAPPPEPAPAPREAPPPEVQLTFPPHIPLDRNQMASADIRRPPTPAPPTPARPQRPTFGPADPGPPAGGAYADTERVEGTGPNGEPLYAARWYREPTEVETRGFLQTATPPSVALIACRTVAAFRVEDCVLLTESPSGSNIGRAVLAMAYQFRVRPPQIGGRPQVGEWVRIRIEYAVGGRVR